MQEVSPLPVIEGPLMSGDSNGSPPSPGPQHPATPLPCPQHTLHRVKEGKSVLGLGRMQMKVFDLGWLRLHSPHSHLYSVLHSAPHWGIPAGKVGGGVGVRVGG